MQSFLSGQSDAPVEKVSEEMAEDGGDLQEGVAPRSAVLRSTIRELQERLDRSRSELFDALAIINECRAWKESGEAKAAKIDALETEIAMLRARLSTSAPAAEPENPDDIVLLDCVKGRLMTPAEQTELLNRLHSTVLKLRTAYQVIGQSRCDYEILKGQHDDLAGKLAPFASASEHAAQQVLLFMADKNYAVLEAFGPILRYNHVYKKWSLAMDDGRDVAKRFDLVGLAKEIDRYKLEAMEEPSIPDAKPVKTLYSDGSVKYGSPVTTIASRPNMNDAGDMF